MGPRPSPELRSPSDFPSTSQPFEAALRHHDSSPEQLDIIALDLHLELTRPTRRGALCKPHSSVSGGSIADQVTGERAWRAPPLPGPGVGHIRSTGDESTSRVPADAPVVADLTATPGPSMAGADARPKARKPQRQRTPANYTGAAVGQLRAFM